LGIVSFKTYLFREKKDIISLKKYLFREKKGAFSPEKGAFRLWQVEKTIIKATKDL
jgi:hypothetical protein